MSKDADRPEPEWKRRARLARIFGDELPDTTSDERSGDGERGESGEPGGSGGSRESGNDARLRRDVPPHHGS